MRLITSLISQKFIKQTYASFFWPFNCFSTKKLQANERKLNQAKKKLPTVNVWDGINISDISKQTNRPLPEIIRSINSGLLGSLRVNSATGFQDRDLLVNLLSLLGYRANFINKLDKKLPPVIDALPRKPPNPEECVPRPPVVTIMGHVDHGKTTLLDALRTSRIVDEEFGGITQHLAAFTLSIFEAAACAVTPTTSKIEKNATSFTSTESEKLIRSTSSDGVITFIDTPGHAAFSAMRSRGAKATDIVLLVVAADDGVMPQTVESIKFAKEANAQILVAINKMDKFGVNSDHVIQGLAVHGVVVERLGGDVQAVEISALKRTNLIALLEAIIIQSEILQISADPTGLAEAVVLESKTEMGLGKIATCLITRGQLKQTPASGPLVAGESIGRARVICNDRGVKVNCVHPGYVATIAGWKTLPHVGELVLELKSESEAKAVVDARRRRRLEQKAESDFEAYNQKMANYRSNYDAYLTKRVSMNISTARKFAADFRKAGASVSLLTESNANQLTLPLIIKTDVDGSLEAIEDLLLTCPPDQCRIQIASSGVGPLTPFEAELAVALNAEVVSFNVDAMPEAIKILEDNSRSVHHHNIIYRLAENIRDLINAKLPSIVAEEILGEACVLKLFEVSIMRGKRQEVIAAGCRCTKGNILSGRITRPGAGQVFFRVQRPSLASNETRQTTNTNSFVDNEKTTILDQAVCYSLRSGRKDLDTVRRDVECGIILLQPPKYFSSLDELYQSQASFSNSDMPIYSDWKVGDEIQCIQIYQKPQFLEWFIDAHD